MLVVSGMAFRHKISSGGARQILSFHIPGDFVDLEGSLLNVADHNVQALTRCELAFVPTVALKKLFDAHPQVALAMWIDTLIDGSIFREWILNVGRRDARERIAHIFCELARRLEAAGMGSTEGYELPMTQEHLADAAGLTAVHVNRTLRAMDRDGLITGSGVSFLYPTGSGCGMSRAFRSSICISIKWRRNHSSSKICSAYPLLMQSAAIAA